MIPVAEAAELLFDAVNVLDTEEVGLDGALHRMLAEEVTADRDLPPTDRSAMDGFAVRSEDLGSENSVLEVVGEIRAGQPAEHMAVGRGQAVRIMTGAVVPPGADAVVKVEDTEEEPDSGKVVIKDLPRPGQHIRRKGEDIRQGESIIPAGSLVRPAEIAALASVGKVFIRAYRRPRVTVLSTGDEVVPPGETPAAHQIRNSNTVTMLAELAEVGVDGRDLGVVPDDHAGLRKALSRGFSSDLLLMSGGVSMGKYDLVGEALADAGMELLFHKVSVKPGKPILAGRKGDCLVIGLPGNPVSAFTGLALFVAPVLRKMSGSREYRTREVVAAAAGRFRHRGGRSIIHLARIAYVDGEYRAAPVVSSGSGDVVSLARANGFFITEPGLEMIEEGERRRAILWRDTLRP